jgi:hypothetical protein
MKEKKNEPEELRCLSSHGCAEVWILTEVYEGRSIKRDNRVIPDHFSLGGGAPELGEQPELGECPIRSSMTTIKRSCLCWKYFSTLVVRNAGRWRVDAVVTIGDVGGSTLEGRRWRVDAVGDAGRWKEKCCVTNGSLCT